MIEKRPRISRIARKWFAKFVKFVAIFHGMKEEWNAV